MKIKFEPNLEYQKEAIEAVTGLFDGQGICSSTFSVVSFDAKGLYRQESELGVGNKLLISRDDILENLKKIQLKNALEPSLSLESLDFTVEMETGTGKTYVYLRTIFELNKLYGMSKFIIVVPSIAIKEGVLKSLQITREHFKSLYDNVPYDFFAYNSANLEQVRSFAANDYIQIMVINIDAFRKSFSDPSKESKANIIHRPNDKLSGYKPIEFIAATNPIVIIDEPQSVDTTPKAKEAIASLNPLCTLRYSATHKEKFHQVYKLDPVDAYNKKLVKQIEVAQIISQNDHNSAYIKLVSVNNKKSPITAKVEIDIAGKNGAVSRKTVTVKQGDDLFVKSNGREVYSGYIINDIYCFEGAEYIDFTSREEIVELGKSIGGEDEELKKRYQIRKTIEEHLDKELRLKPMGIKVLSLFFIDKVANYRYYDSEGNAIKGKYARIFEEEFLNIAKKPKYRALFEGEDLESLVESVHNGYFSIDKKGRVKDTSGKTKDDEDTYNLIMKDKEKLLSLDNSLKFIFSHSALREGWDNPNIFQICTLNDSKSVIKKRQEIGRGLRLCVNQKGERVYGFEVNTLTIMANESYDEFAKKLQKEIEEDTGIKFGYIEKHSFANIVMDEGYIGFEKSGELWEFMLENYYIDSSGKIQDSLKLALKEKRLQLPKEFETARVAIEALLKKTAGNLNVKDASKKRVLKLNKEVYLSEDFAKLWDKIKYKTTYRVEFDEDKLIEKCANEIAQNLFIGKPSFLYSKAGVEIDQGGVEVAVKEDSSFVYDGVFMLPDIVSFLQNETNLTRNAIVQILIKSGKLEHFVRNPQKFIEQAANFIKRTMREFIVDGIKYEKIGKESYYAQEVFESQELAGYLGQNLQESKKGVYDYVIYDSDIEKNLTASFERNDAIKLYAKLPPSFKISPPLGSYNPDWAIVVEKEGEEKLYFVVESKGKIYDDTSSPIENSKIKCAKEHFKAISSDVEYFRASGFEDIEARIS